MNKTFFIKLFALFLCVLLLSNPALAKEGVYDSLKLCSKSVIPSLFPFAVLTGFVFFDGKGLPVTRWVSLPIKLIFGIPESLCPAFLLGIFAGFPMGAAALSLVLKNGLCTKRQAAYVLCLSSLPSPAFINGYVGQGILGSPFKGVLLLLILWSCVLPVSIVLRFTWYGAQKNNPEASHEANSSGFVQFNFLRAFIFAIKNAAVTMINTSSYIVFFGVISRFLFGNGDVGNGDISSCIIMGILELTGGLGMVQESGLHDLYIFLLCLVLLGFGGICALIQVISVFDENCGISFLTYFFSRIYFAFFAFLFGLLYMIFVPQDILKNWWNQIYLFQGGSGILVSSLHFLKRVAILLVLYISATLFFKAFRTKSNHFKAEQE